jgi:hypothetical protein
MTSALHCVNVSGGSAGYDGRCPVGRVLSSGSFPTHPSPFIFEGRYLMEDMG